MLMEIGWQWKGAEQGHCNTRRIPPDLEAKAQQHENGVASLPSQQQGSQTCAESQLQQQNPALLLRDKYLGVTLDRSLTYRRHLESLRKKLTSRVALLSRLAGSGWDAGATTLRTATLALVHSTAEYCAPVWCRSAHTRLIDPTINDALRIVTGMPASCTSGQPSNPSRHPTCWASSQSCHTISRTPCHGGWTPAPLSARPSIGCSCTAHQIETPICTRRTTHQFFWQHTCGAVWADNPTRLRTSIPDTGTHTPGMTVPRRTWVRLNRLRTGVGRFRSCLYKWGMASSAAQNKPSTMSSSTAWRFWTMRQPNGCSTPAPKSRRASNG